MKTANESQNISPGFHSLILEYKCLNHDSFLDQKSILDQNNIPNIHLVLFRSLHKLYSLFFFVFFFKKR